LTSSTKGPALAPPARKAAEQRRCEMKQRAVVLIADYLYKCPKGRVVRVMQIADDDYMIGIEDVRDGRTQLMRSVGDLEVWLESFRQGRCEPAAFGICGVCDRVHNDGDVDGEILANCIRCTVELIEVAAERYQQGGAA
jgi:hypothetical protein